MSNTILEFDAGNTRIKWRLLKRSAELDGEVLASGAVLALEKTPAVFLELCKQFEGLPVRTIARVLVASVRGESFKTAFSAFLFEKWQLQPVFITVDPDSGLIHNRYQEPAKLGVDRWLGMLAAYARHRKECVVLGFGTAVTVDFINAAGVHAGGYIVPGLQLMKAALMQRSKALVIDDRPWGALEPGLDTSAAIHHGLLAMVAGFVRDLHAQQQAHNPDAAWVLTGGDAAILQPLLGWNTHLEPDLVLNGIRYSQEAK